MGFELLKHDYYHILKLQKRTKSTQREITQAFKRLVRGAHSHFTDGTKPADSKEKLLLIQEAYDTLKDKKSRSIYDIQYDFIFSPRGPALSNSSPWSSPSSSASSSASSSESLQSRTEKELSFVRSKMVEVSRKIRALEKCIENLDRMRSKAPRFREKTNEEIGEEIKRLKEQIWELGRVGNWFEDREDELVLCGEFEDIAFMET